ncbi:GON domain-containing protein [Nannocystis exedens]|uniref:GON domain-containing protein n=1 Tax=Nannocystis exedens TaxID=54 RepID=A0A1I1VZ06_9BACT|nr:GON domain-containing protein [Nannocystis exedens]PCC72911.1 peptidase S8/S53 subtilisin kexin sedolisin [Nannocystis exedens]SFD87318.1 GON domain-containing protein [Nannocystis exedens]
MHLRDSFILASLFATTACPLNPGTTTDDAATTETTDEPGTTGSTESMTTGLANTPPTAPVVAITPASPTALDDLVCSVTTESTDPDGDAVSYTFVWTRDGVDAGLATETVPAAELADGQEWECIVTPSDGIDEGPSGAAKVQIGAAPVVPETCADVKASQPAATDGAYTLYIGKDPNKPWTAHCKDMAAVPVEYLPLVNVQEGRNFSQYTASNNSPGTDVRTRFTHLRIDPITLLVDIDDVTFSSSTGQLMHGQVAVTSMPYAVAEGCSGTEDSVANVDLVGTPFKLKESFCTAGFGALGGAVLGMSDQVADLTGGGGCGWTSPSIGDTCTDNPQNKNSGFVLDLEYIDPFDQACQSHCANALECGIFPDLPTCMTDCLNVKTGDPECDAAITVTTICVSMQNCEDLAKTLYDQMFGDCSDERMAEDVPCM